MNAKIVIGANYGDEGKGITTQYLCRKSNVILSHGGMQRGHTVHLTNKKYTHHALSSGTFFNSNTVYGKEFIINPHIFCKEIKEMHAIPNIYIHKQCRFSTIYDMMINCIIEESRTNKFGTVGVGIWETIKRYEYGRKSISLYDFLQFSDSQKRKYIDSLRVYASCSLIEHNIDINKLEWGEIFNNIDYSILLEDFYNLENYVHFYDDYMDNNINSDTIIFENSQGLMLDYFVSGDYNCSTPSRTGLFEPMNIIKDMKNIETIDAYYVTRPYITRHGYGYLPNEALYNDVSTNIKINDEINIANKYQGSFRYARFNEKLAYDMFSRIENDMSEFSNNFDIKKNLVITHCDEIVPEYLIKIAKYFSFDNIILLENGNEFEIV